MFTFRSNTSIKMADSSQESGDASTTSESVSGDQGSPVACRRILSSADIQMWIHCEGYRDYINFIKQLNEFAKRKHGLNSRSGITNQSLQKVVSLLDHLSGLADQIEPFNDDRNQRFVLSIMYLYSPQSFHLQVREQSISVVDR